MAIFLIYLLFNKMFTMANMLYIKINKIKISIRRGIKIMFLYNNIFYSGSNNNKRV